MPVLELHLDAAKRYGKTMLELGWTPQSILKSASKSKRPLATFLAKLDHVGVIAKTLYVKRVLCWR